jgi:hypothetical protein
VEDDHAGGALRSIGAVVTDTRRQRDGWVRMTSQAAFDSGQLLRGTPLDTQQPSERVFVTGACEIDPSGNLGSFRAGVRLGEFVRQDVLVVEGHLRKNRIEVTARGLGVPWRQSFPYEPRSMVQNSLQPLDRMPGLQVGQRWESRVVSPLTGRIETARVEVAGRGHITWDDKPTPVLIVITRVPPFTARTWVRNDGVVLRQEVPFPLAKIVLERAAETPELATQRQDHP